MRTHRHLNVQPAHDAVTGALHSWDIVDDDGELIAEGIATRQDAEDRADRITGADD